MAKNTIPNNHDGVDVCILMCKHAKYCGPNVFDYECTCDEECVKFNKFDIPEKDKHTEQYIREQTIREVVPIVMEFFNDLCFTNEGTVFYHSDEDREECMKDVLAKVYEELKRKKEFEAHNMKTCSCSDPKPIQAFESTRRVDL